MHIAVNLRTYFKGKIGGLENYVRHVVGGISSTADDEERQVTIFAQRTEVEHVREFAPNATVVPLAPKTALHTIATEIENGPYDLLFCPLLVLEPLPPPLPSAVMIPDLQHEFFPEFFEASILQWRHQTYRPSALHADIVYTLSEHAKDTIVQRLGADPEKIVVVYLDVDDEFKKEPTVEGTAAFHELHLPPNYLFFPANFWPHKNHSSLLQAMQLLVKDKKYSDLALVFTGAPSTGVERVQAEVAALALQKHVKFLGYLERQLIVELYRHARAVPFVSKFEGFGIPIVEAFHTGTPVIISQAGSCSEIAGAAALVADENNPADIAAALERILEDPVLCAELVEKGKHRAQQFSWRRAVQLTLDSFVQKIPQGRRPAQEITLQEYPVVSIVTPSLNMARFLEETIQSVLNQDYPYIDYIVMDGGSTDGSVEILQRYKGCLRYESRPDRGQADAVNRGFAVSRGSIFAFLNADDTYLPGAVETAVKHMLANPKAGLIYGEAYHVHEDGQIIDRYPTFPFNFRLLNRRCFICQPAAFMQREAFARVDGMNIELHFALDYDLWIRIAKLYPVLKIDTYLATSRMYRENKTLSKRQQVYQEILKVAKTHYGYVPYSWLYGYASYLVDKKDQFFESSQRTLLKSGVSLLVGCYYNPRYLLRYVREWMILSGIKNLFRRQ